MNVIAMPIEFKHMVRHIGGDIDEFVKSVDDLVAISLIGVDHRQAAPVRPFLTALMARNLSANAMVEFWSSTPSGVYFVDGEFVRKFLTALLAKIKSEPYLTGNATQQ